MYRSAFLAPNNLTHSFGNKNQMHSMANISPLANGTAFYNAQPHSYFPNMGNNIRQSHMTRGGGNVGGRRINNLNAPQLARQANSRHSDYQLKVGGECKTKIHVVITLMKLRCHRCCCRILGWWCSE